MNFMRGNQMIVHDRRLKDPGETHWFPGTSRPPGELYPPTSKFSWNVDQTCPCAHIIDQCSQVASAWGTMDALHFMAHGNKGRVQIGAEGFSYSNIRLFSKLKGHVRNIVFFSCMVGGELGDLAECSTDTTVWAQYVAAASGAKVIACNLNQVYSWKAKIIDFGDFEGDVFVIYPEGCFDMYNTAAGHPLVLERFIFDDPSILE